jgi:hypothetical protein
MDEKNLQIIEIIIDSFTVGKGPLENKGIPS